jgi:hypothetical protein
MEKKKLNLLHKTQYTVRIEKVGEGEDKYTIFMYDRDCTNRFDNSKTMEVLSVWDGSHTDFAPSYFKEKTRNPATEAEKEKAQKVINEYKKLLSSIPDGHKYVDRLLYVHSFILKRGSKYKGLF